MYDFHNNNNTDERYTKSTQNGFTKSKSTKSNRMMFLMFKSSWRCRPLYSVNLLSSLIQFHLLYCCIVNSNCISCFVSVNLTSFRSCGHWTVSDICDFKPFFRVRKFLYFWFLNSGFSVISKVRKFRNSGIAITLPVYFLVDLNFNS